MFALRHVLNKFNQTRKLDDSALPELGSGAGGGSLEEGSGEELASASDDWPGAATDNHLTTPAPNRTPSAPPILDRKFESILNALPESIKASVMSAWLVTSGASRDVVFRSDEWVQQLEELEREIYSGNGMTELETRHNSFLCSLNSLQPQLSPGNRGTNSPTGQPGPGLDPEEEEDIFQAQGYLPFFSQTLRPEVQASTTGTPTTTQTSTSESVGVVVKALPLSLDYEGSGSLPQPSNQTL